MKYTLKSGLTIGMMVAALALTGGCGDNDNNHNDNGHAQPTRTATPKPGVTPTAVAPTVTPATEPTSTPSGTTEHTVTFDFTAAHGIQAFQVRVAYPKEKGSFAGAADQVECTVDGGGGIFTKNHNDAAGTLTLSVANTSDLTFPINIQCTFEATAAISADDLDVTVQEVTQNNAPGNVADLSVGKSVS
ncbi:MAG: hypothetical protein B6D46_12880 [Polyangiaceae bacterium UTPRO1]|jgi:hypothetical protein|nr:hypothetical protein [Myxococcales bacterium]OQY65590.1 MAG: hypothetical protein B6D46_12880 [Polyangiaceae bacterium UTPRO1]